MSVFKRDNLIDFVHVGDYKTATTWFQRVYFKQHPEIYCIGDPPVDSQIKVLLDEIIDYRDLDFSSDDYRRRLIQWFEKHKIPYTTKVVGISREALCGEFLTGAEAKERARRIKDVFGRVKIIYIVREQISMLKSLYSQYIKEGGTANFEAFLFDPLIAKGMVVERLKYHKQVKMYQEFFGKENVLVNTYELFKIEPKQFLFGLSKFLTVDMYEISTSNVLNKSLSMEILFLLRFLQRFVRSEFSNNPSLGVINKIIKKIIFQFIDIQSAVKAAPPHYNPFKNTQNKYNKYIIDCGKERVLGWRLRRLCEIMNNKCQFVTNNYSPIPSKMVASLKEVFKASNKELERLTGLNLSKFGYSI